MKMRYMVLFAVAVAVVASLVAFGFRRGRHRTDASVAILPGHYFVEHVRFAPLGGGSRLSWPSWRLTYAARDYPTGRRLPLSFSLTGRPLYAIRYGIHQSSVARPLNIHDELLKRGLSDWNP